LAVECGTGVYELWKWLLKKASVTFARGDRKKAVNPWLARERSDLSAVPMCNVKEGLVQVLNAERVSTRLECRG